MLIFFGGTTLSSSCFCLSINKHHNPSFYRRRLSYRAEDYAGSLHTLVRAHALLASL